MKKGDVVFWHDPDDGECSGVRKVLDVRDDMIVLTDLEGNGITEALSDEVVPVEDAEVIGIEANGDLIYWGGEPYVTGQTEKDDLDLTDEERKRIAAIKAQNA